MSKDNLIPMVGPDGKRVLRCMTCGKKGGHPSLSCKRCAGLHLTRMHNLPLRSSANPLFAPWELGYLCPKKHTSPYLEWSEFVDYIWCCRCEKDYRSQDCFLRRPASDSREAWQMFLTCLPFKPKVLPGVSPWSRTVM